jgi:hypothetical protein
MVRGGGVGLALKGLQWFLRVIEFCCAALILGVFSYFLAALHNHGLNIDNYTRSIEGISGAAALYTLIGLLLLCFVAGMTFFSLFAILVDLAFIGAFIYVAYETRSGAGSCSGTVTTVFGTGDVNGDSTVPSGNGGTTTLPSFKQACQLETACFSVSIVAMYALLPSQSISFRKANISQCLLPPLRSCRSRPHATPSQRESLRPLSSQQLHCRLHTPPQPLLATQAS